MFEVYITHKGPRLLTDERTIEIVHRIAENRPVRVTGSAEETEELEAILSRLFDMDVISFGNERPSTLADRSPKLISQPLMTAVTEESDRVRLKVPFMQNSVRTDNLEHWFWTYLNNSAKVSGISIAPLLSHAHYLFGKTIGENNPKDPNPLSLERIANVFRQCNLANITVTSRQPFGLKYEFISNVTLGSAEACIQWISSAVSGYLSVFTGCDYRVASSSISGGSKYVAKVVLQTGVAQDIPFARKMCGSCECDFAIYWNGKRYVPVKGTLQISLLAEMQYKAFTVDDLVERFGIGKDSVQSMMKPLVDEGLVKVMKYQKMVTYRISSSRAFDWSSIEEPLIHEEERCMRLAASDPSHAIRYWFHYYLLLCRRIGLDYNVLCRFLGMRIGVKVTEESRGAKLDELLYKLEEVPIDGSAPLKVVSRSPFTITHVMDSEMSDFIAGRYRIIFDAVMSTILSESSGVPFGVVESSMGGEGNRQYTASFAQSFLLHR